MNQAQTTILNSWECALDSLSNFKANFRNITEVCQLLKEQLNQYSYVLMLNEESEDFYQDLSQVIRGYDCEHLEKLELDLKRNKGEAVTWKDNYSGLVKASARLKGNLVGADITEVGSTSPWVCTQYNI